jgi:hypothetical protein
MGNTMDQGEKGKKRYFSKTRPLFNDEEVQLHVRVWLFENGENITAYGLVKSTNNYFDSQDYKSYFGLDS